MFGSRWFPEAWFSHAWFAHNESGSTPPTRTLVYHIRGTVTVDIDRVDITSVTVTPL